MMLGGAGGRSGAVVAAVMSRTFFVVDLESWNRSGVCSMYCDVEALAWSCIRARVFSICCMHRAVGRQVGQ